MDQLNIENTFSLEKMRLENMTSDECFELIIDISIDYDGYEKTQDLKFLIDEIRTIAQQGLLSLKENNGIGNACSKENGSPKYKKQ